MIVHVMVIKSTRSHFKDVFRPLGKRTPFQRGCPFVFFVVDSISFLYYQVAEFNMEHGYEQNPSQYNILINGRQKSWNDKVTSYSQIVNLAFPPPHGNSMFVVQYSRGPKENPEGTLVDGKEVETQDGMVFDVARTDKS